ncbi:hypothetical protein A6770_27705 [Nostoc minutum NIES-26]|uniref:Nitroreductase domain-containing protein n=1 Tax=Nostoc minutum NIES-26 TaxID=1844469 RepID=A0A367QQK8_9NOSO|nr:hypothetical protein A6770_27705 [Nostoc minutum NIES-26]
MVYWQKLLNKGKLYTQFARSLLANRFLFWSIYVINTKLRYKFDALYYGLLINKNSQANLYNFRRNIHRLEKGLSYQHIKSLFAEDYIWETVYYLKEDEELGLFDANTKKWGESVLDLYFQTCQHSDKIREAYELYQTIKYETNESNCLDWIPYTSDSRPALSINYEALYQLALRRRSIRFYLKNEVDPVLIKKAMDVAALSPSACNRQSFKYLFFNEKRLVKEIAQIPGGVTGYEIPSVVVVIGSYRGYFDERDINAPLIDSSLSVMAFLFALETLGLSSVCINWPNLPDREKKMRQLIYLEPDEFIVMLIGVGYPFSEGKIPYSAKRSIENLIMVNERIIKN